MQTNDLVEVLALALENKEIKNGTFVTICTNTEVSMNKKNNPLISRDLRKITIYNNAQIGCDYKNIMDNAAKRCGNESDYQVQKNTGKGVFTVGKIISTNEKGKSYLHMYFYKKNNSFKKYHYYVLDGKIITEENEKEWALITSWDKAYKRSSEPCNKQVENGITDGNEIPLTLTISAENVVYIRQSNNVIFNREKSI